MTGIKFDAGKERWDLLPLGPIRDVVRILTFGAAKYGPSNWMEVEDFENRYYAALMRHLYAWRAGEDIDPESGMLHLSHSACNIIFLLWYSLEKRGFGHQEIHGEERKDRESD